MRKLFLATSLGLGFLLFWFIMFSFYPVIVEGKKPKPAPATKKPMIKGEALLKSGGRPRPVAGGTTGRSTLIKGH